ncbi:MAG TPA: hypothetical protein ENK50_12135 [Sedimenticola sp.]|nr:hypothetical protein [Sedimenticola sp.]
MSDEPPFFDHDEYERCGTVLEDLPTFSEAECRALDDDALYSVIRNLGPLLPREVAAEAARRGEGLASLLASHLADPAHWTGTADEDDVWALAHAILILGLMPGKTAEAGLRQAHIRRRSEPGHPVWRWLEGYWPGGDGAPGDPLAFYEPQRILARQRTLEGGG